MDIKSYIESQLNGEQSAAALHIDTSSLIIAGAGSGKTRTLIYKIAYLMFGKYIHHNKILAVTFTNKAANEMKERLVKISKEMQDMGMVTPTESTQQANGEGGVEDFLAFIESTAPAISAPQLNAQSFSWIGTFHSIFLKILKQDIEHLGMKYTKNF